jgi:hypothetical protein
MSSYAERQVSIAVAAAIPHLIVSALLAAPLASMAGPAVPAKAPEYSIPFADHPLGARRALLLPQSATQRRPAEEGGASKAFGPGRSRSFGSAAQGTRFDAPPN